jgi:hypothetical protein
MLPFGFRRTHKKRLGYNLWYHQAYYKASYPKMKLAYSKMETLAFNNGGKKTTKEVIHELAHNPNPYYNLSRLETISRKEGEALPTIRCSCGAEILVLPDLEAMSKALKNHVEDHRRINPKSPDAELSTVEQELVEKLLKLAAELGK